MLDPSWWSYMWRLRKHSLVGGVCHQRLLPVCSLYSALVDQDVSIQLPAPAAMPTLDSRLPHHHGLLTVWNYKSKETPFLSAAVVRVLYHSNRKGPKTVHYSLVWTTPRGSCIERLVSKAALFRGD